MQKVSILGCQPIFNGTPIDKKGHYTIKLKTKQLHLGKERYIYVDDAK